MHRVQLEDNAAQREPKRATKTRGEQTSTCEEATPSNMHSRTVNIINSGITAYPPNGGARQEGAFRHRVPPPRTHPPTAPVSLGGRINAPPRMVLTRTRRALGVS